MSKISELKIDVQGMRDKILDLAIRGKLVSQDENDESASILLEKIAREKEQLIKEKKIKKTKPLPEITVEEKPFDIPDSWEWVRLGEVTIPLQYGFTASAASSGNSKFLRITDIQNGQVNWKKVPWCNISRDKLEKLKIKNGDILIARTGGTVGKSFVVNNLQEQAVFASYLIRIRLLNIDTIYGKVLLNSSYYWNYISDKKSGTGQPNVNATKLSELLIPIPPLNEQKRIATKIEELFSLLGTIEESTKNYENLQKELKEKVLNLGMQGKLVEQDIDDEPADELYEKIQAKKAELIKEKKIKKTNPLPEITAEEKPFSLPNNWKWVRFGEIGIFRNGKTPKKEDIAGKGRYPYFKVSDMNTPLNRRYLKYTANYVSSKYDHQTMPENTIVFPKNGGAVLTAKKRILSTQSLVDLNTGGITGFDLININFLFYLFSNVNILNYIRGSAIPTIDSKKLKNMIVGLPPLNEQKRIATKIESLFNLIDN